MKEYSDAFEDIYGEQYKKHCGPGKIFSSSFNFSISFCIDSVSTGNSTNKSL